MSFILALLPGRLWIYLALAGAIAGLGAMGAWRVQAWRIDNIKTEHALALSDAKERVHAAEQANQTKIIEALNAKTKREIVNKTAAAGASNQLYSLRNVAAAYIAKDSSRTSNERIATLGTVFSQCSDALVEMGGTADRLASDRQLLLDSWPR